MAFSLLAEKMPFSTDLKLVSLLLLSVPDTVGLPSVMITAMSYWVLLSATWPMPRSQFV